jgi:hypothetical protein
LSPVTVSPPTTPLTVTVTAPAGIDAWREFIDTFADAPGCTAANDLEP